jgi:hypothetical protein
VLTTVALLFALAVTAEVRAGGSSRDPLWTKHWTPPNPGTLSSGGHLARSATGDVYSGGEITRLSTGHLNWLVARYTSAGTRKWVRTFAGRFSDAYFHAIAADANGNVILVGGVMTATHAQDWMVVKWSRAGKLLWKRQVDGTAHDVDVAEDVVVGTDGSIYVTGSSTGAGTSQDGLTVKYSPSGHVLWSKVYDGAEHNADAFFAIARDAKNRVYVTGYDYATGRANDCLLIRYSPGGHRDWLRRWGDPAVAKHDVGLDVAVRGSYVAVAGSTMADPATWSQSGLALKYSTAGTLKWHSAFANADPALDALWLFVDIDAKGRVAVGGLADLSPSPYDVAWTTTVYTAAGVAAPVQTLQGDRASGNYINDLRMTAAGTVYETGSLGYTASNCDLYVIALTHDGAPLWGSRINGATSVNDFGFGVVPTSTGVFVGGLMGVDLVLLKYKP